jgi:hypothetical protein
MFDDRFARQNRYEPPSEFPLTSPYTGIVHHLSGPKNNALTQTYICRYQSVDAAHAWHHSLSFRVLVSPPPHSR